MSPYKDQVYDILEGYSLDISHSFKELTHILNRTKELLEESAQFCDHVGTANLDIEHVRDMLSRINCVSNQITDIAPNIEQFSEYLGHCGVPMAPKKSVFFNLFDEEGIVLASHHAKREQLFIENEPLKTTKYLYFITDDRAELIRYNGHAEVLSLQRPIWTELRYNHPYERELSYGEGNICLKQLRPEHVIDILTEWLYKASSNTP